MNLPTLTVHVRPPTRSRASKTTTSTPFSARTLAAARPETPAPMMITSWWLVVVVVVDEEDDDDIIVLEVEIFKVKVQE